MQNWPAADPIAFHAQARPDALACVDLATGRRWTYGELDLAVRRGATALRSTYRLEQGERMGVVARNSVDLVIMQQAAARCGVIFVPVNWRLAASERQGVLNDFQPKLIVTDGAASVDDHGREVETVAGFVKTLARAEPDQARSAAMADWPAILLYTSGTSGAPKGVVLTNANLIATAHNFGVLGEVTHESVFLSEGPMFHVIGMVTSLYAPLLRGGAIYMSPNFEPERTNEWLANDEIRATHYFCVPQMAQAIRQCGNFQPERWRLKGLFTGGAPNPPANIRWWLEHGVSMVDGYGMTEAGTLLGMPIDRRRLREKAGSVGVPAPGIGLRIVSSGGDDVAVGAVGEIIVAGANVSPGYWTAHGVRSMAENGWFHTGDLARRDEEGFITIVNRLKDMYISGGENIYPGEIETVILDHPGVLEVAVIGLPDEQWGEVGRAFVALRSGANVSAQALKEHCEARLARYKLPKEICFIEKLPRNAAGKLVRQKLLSKD